jgi:hypothetical protein
MGLSTHQFGYQPRQFGKTKKLMAQRKLDPDKLTLHFDWIQKILSFKVGKDDIRDGDFWMTQRQQDKFVAFQRQVREMATSGNWGDYATVSVDPELTGVIEDFLEITFAAQLSCYNCGKLFDDLSSRDSHEEECIG